MTALNETPWGKIAPQVIAVAVNDENARAVINDFMADRIATVKAAFSAAQTRGEIGEDVPVQQLIEMAIAVPYFRKLIAGLPLDQCWLDAHVDLISGLATGVGPD